MTHSTLLRDIAYWGVGICTALLGVAIKHHASASQPVQIIMGTVIAMFGVMVIAIGLSRKWKRRVMQAQRKVT